MQRARRRRRGSAAAAGNGHGNGSANGHRGRGILAVLAFGLVGLFAVMLAGGGAAAIYGLNRYDAIAAEAVPPEELIAKLPRGGARIYDRNGTLLYEFVDEFGGLRRPVALSEISEHLRKATISTEDATFYENNGLNTKGLARAGWENFSPFNDDTELFEGSGGSSITQQLVKNIYIPKEERAERSVERKMKEAVFALELTKKYSKDQILEWYLNSISYSGIFVGVEAAAQGYFGKPAKDLTLPEAALLAGIPQSPASYDPYQNPEAAKKRQGDVLGLMVKHGAITQAEADEAAAAELNIKTARKFDIQAPHFVLGPVAREIEARFGPRALYEQGLEVVTSIDMGLQRLGEEAVERRVADVEASSGGHNGALYALDPNTGQVLAYVGSRDYFRDDIQGRNDNIRSLNSPGSTLKPFTYMSAFMQGWGTGTQILDSPVSVFDPSTGRNFSPRNPSGNYMGNVSVASALGNSLNVPAFKAILFAGVDNVVSLLKQSGLTSLTNPGGYGPALTLGGVDVRLDDLTLAYSVFPNGGVLKGQQPVTPHPTTERKIDPVILLKVTNAEGNVLHEFTKPAEQRVVNAPFTYLVTSILSDPANTCLTFSCGGLGMPGRPSAAKTGTSEPYENSRAIGETWTFGYTPDLVVGVWAGNADNSRMDNILSTTISWRAWRDFMVDAHNQLKLPVKSFVRPPGIEDRATCWPSGRLATELCPREFVTRGLTASEVLAKEKKIFDTWWQRVKIDARTGQLAGPGAPQGLVYEELRLVIPDAELAEYPGLLETIAARGASHYLVSSSTSSGGGGSAAGGALLSIGAPSLGQRVSGVVTISGRADSPNFERYVLEWGRGSDPSAWTELQSTASAVAGGPLGSWDTRGLPAGEYAIRLRLIDGQRGTLYVSVPVVVEASAPAAPTVTPASGSGANSSVVALLSSPAQGSTVTGAVQVRGTAFAAVVADAVVEYSAGAQASTWTPIARLNRAVVDGTLGVWDTTNLANGLYVLRLTVRDSTGATSSSVFLVTVQN